MWKHTWWSGLLEVAQEWFSACSPISGSQKQSFAPSSLLLHSRNQLHAPTHARVWRFQNPGSPQNLWETWNICSSRRLRAWSSDGDQPFLVLKNPMQLQLIRKCLWCKIGCLSWGTVVRCLVSANSQISLQLKLTQFTTRCITNSILLCTVVSQLHWSTIAEDQFIRLNLLGVEGALVCQTLTIKDPHVHNRLYSIVCNSKPQWGKGLPIGWQYDNIAANLCPFSPKMLLNSAMKQNGAGAAQSQPVTQTLEMI